MEDFKMLKNFTRDESGNIALTSAVVLLMLLTGIGAAIDISNVIAHKTSLQDANDTATLAAVTIDPNDQDTASSNSLDIFNFNQGQSHLENMQYDITFDDDKITGVATASYPLFFAAVLPQAKIPITVKTVVARNTIQSNLCIKALNQTAQFAFRANSGTQVIAPQCEIQVDSTSPPSADFNNGVSLDVARVCVAGRNVSNRLGRTDIIKTSCDVDPDPYANRFPVPNDTCEVTSRTYRDKNVRLDPGVYCGGFNFGPEVEKVTFEPGQYSIKDGSWTVDGGEWEGDGVTFYFMDQRSGIQFNSGVKARLTPPTSGPYQDVFITEAPNLPPSNFVINDARGFDFEGIIYLPSRQLIMNSGATVRSRRLSLVADRILINEAVLNIEPLETPVSSLTTAGYISQ